MNVDFSGDILDEDMIDPKKKALLDLIKQMKQMIVEGLEEEEIPEGDISDVMEEASDDIIEPYTEETDEIVEDLPMEDEDYAMQGEEEGQGEEEVESGIDREEMSEFMKGRKPKKAVSLSIMRINSKGKDLEKNKDKKDKKK